MNERYEQLLQMGVRLLQQWERLKAWADTAEGEGSIYAAEYLRGQLRDCVNRLQSLGDVAAELFDHRHDEYMNTVHQRVNATKNKLNIGGNV